MILLDFGFQFLVFNFKINKMKNLINTKLFIMKKSIEYYYKNTNKLNFKNYF